MYFDDEDNPFKKFQFEELVEMVRTISRTKTQSREGVWKDGHGLQSIDHLEAHVDDILDELARRIRANFTIDRIQRNFRYNKLNLPTEFLNLYNLTAAQLNFMIYKDKNSIGAILTDGKEEIFIKHGPVRYVMNTEGNIAVIKEN
ncbi:hypothetical protein NEF87_004507 [Candidatus Lokiarchaeum ossiferum]|uniref:Uncharacterized protein n=1 Tax=Candidatus Lokiarchaeum ossiferum TaxID=2951803 RepID=A0ABY6HZB7_9ARCH|nr:hypothetical protein NEF87_004507 [Candidatus Lokiarchaeum sp. B-35]